jgi:GAF domain-containing protein
VRDFGVLAYLGVPLATDEGQVLGSLCAVDTVPRAWTPDDLAALQDVVASVMTEIALRREVAVRRGAAAALAPASSASARCTRRARWGSSRATPRGSSRA